MVFCGAFEASDRPALPSTPGETLKRLRKAKGLAQGGLAKVAGIGATTVCACEWGSDDEQHTAMAEVLDIPREVLSEFGLKNPNAAWHLLIEFTHIYGLVPKCIGEIVVLTHDNDCKRPLDKLFTDWHLFWVDLRQTGEQATCQDW